jgi:hypothetical protein
VYRTGNGDATFGLLVGNTRGKSPIWRVFRREWGSKDEAGREGVGNLLPLGRLL